MIPIDSITIRAGEGRYAGATITVTDWPAANAWLLLQSTVAPATGGYDKHDFTITWEDGETYEGRYDLKHYSIEWPNLKRHVEGFARFMAGLRRPTHMTAEEYVLCVSRDDIEAWKSFVENYLEG